MLKLKVEIKCLDKHLCSGCVIRNRIESSRSLVKKKIIMTLVLRIHGLILYSAQLFAIEQLDYELEMFFIVIVDEGEGRINDHCV